MKSYQFILLIIFFQFYSFSSDEIQKKHTISSYHLAPVSIFNKSLPPSHAKGITNEWFRHKSPEIKKSISTQKSRLSPVLKFRNFVFIMLFVSSISACTNSFITGEKFEDDNSYVQDEVTDYLSLYGFSIPVVNRSTIPVKAETIRNLLMDAGLSQTQIKIFKKIIFVNKADISLEGADNIPMYCQKGDTGIVYVNADLFERDMERNRSDILIHVWSHELAHLVFFKGSIPSSFMTEMESKAIPGISNPRDLVLLTAESELVWKKDQSRGIQNGFPSPYAAYGNPNLPANQTQKNEYLAEISGMASRLQFYYRAITGSSSLSIKDEKRYEFYLSAFYLIQELSNPDNALLEQAFSIYESYGIISPQTLNAISCLKQLIGTYSETAVPMNQDEFLKNYPTDSSLSGKTLGLSINSKEFAISA